MIIKASKLPIIDNSGVISGRCIQVYTPSCVGRMGHNIKVSIVRYDNRKGLLRDRKKRRQFRKGTLKKALIARTRCWFQRVNGVYITFNQNGVILIDKNKRPLSNKIKGPLLKEFKRWNTNVCSMSDDLV